MGGQATFTGAGIPALRRALLKDADAHAERATRFYRAARTEADLQPDPYLAAWSALALADAHNRLIAALLGIAQRDPGLSAPGRQEMARLAGRLLDGWPEALEGANDDVEAPAVACGCGPCADPVTRRPASGPGGRSRPSLLAAAATAAPDTDKEIHEPA